MLRRKSCQKAKQIELARVNTCFMKRSQRFTDNRVEEGYADLTLCICSFRKFIDCNVVTEQCSETGVGWETKPK